jgi:hypothetical protein
MSWFNHRTQLGGGTPVGGPLLRETVAPVPVTRRSDGTAPGGKLAPPQNELHFSVQYGLPEYLSFMRQHAAYLIRRRRVGRVTGFWLLSKSTSAAAMHFVAQGRGQRLYDFSIDDHGIIRVCGTGVTLVPWADVSAIRRYTRGYVVVLKRGTLPIPFRCLNAAQLTTMELFMARVKAAARR